MKADICIIGGGSAGVGAAYRSMAASREPVSVVIVEKDQGLGGTSTNGGVNNWEPGIGGPGLHLLLARSLSPHQAGTAGSTHFFRPDEPYGMSVIAPNLPYEASLRRSGLKREENARFHFEPHAMARAMENILYDAAQGHTLAIRYSTCFLDAETRGRRISRIRVCDCRSNVVDTVEAKVFIDASADVAVARAAGCRTAFGEESSATYGETLAPEDPSGSVNGVSFIIRAAEEPAAYQVPQEGDLPDWTAGTDAAIWASSLHSAAIIRYPNGDLNINCLPTMNGDEFFSFPDYERTRICRARMYHLWHKYRIQYGFNAYRLCAFAPNIGVRESYRLVGRYVLREQDVLAGFLHQENRSRIVAFADHSLDIHGSRNVKYRHCMEIKMPYGIPFDCMLPVEADNLLVACRGASFSHIAASSCRLSRTMMALGEAAGTAAALALQSGGEAGSVEPSAIRDMLALPQFEERISEEWDL